MEGGRAKRKPPDYDMVREEEEETVAHFPLSTRPSPPSISSSREHVMSEVHLGCPPHFSGPYISRFTFRSPLSEPDATEEMCNELVGGAPTCQMLCLDNDGDLVLPRPSKMSINCGVTIQHKITSSISSVGLQVWRAAMVLADFVLHTIFTSSDFNNIVALELGAGTGLVGILLARVARTVFLTDCDDEILGNCATNADLNSRMLKYHGASVHVREINWKKSWPPTPRVDECHFPSEQGSRYSWTPLEIEEAEGASVILAADVIYSDDLTDAFFNTLAGLMLHGSKKVLYLALEKRYNFSLDDLDIVANGYSHFRSYLRDEGECRTLGGGMPCFVGKLVHLAQIPQYIREYDRGNDLEIWEIKYSSLDTTSHRKESKISV
ncbi:uncharacterized protein LOC131258283 isoform X1 [Magnolia sinica]|uniref:uncharacterized protein LOC131258283 isoform X1 n=1 Tax=Magnolia sinica TaxID=86752 RepID=UPI002658DCC5|nr:uncharacterized protein LOC131258283 isoform X1 [Magnolia sinica]